MVSVPIELPGVIRLPDASVVAPTVPEPPSRAPDATVTAEPASEPFTISVPSLTLVAPAKSPLPAIVQVLEPVFSRLSKFWYCEALPMPPSSVQLLEPLRRSTSLAPDALATTLPSMTDPA